jgi:hypothetical protein
MSCCDILGGRGRHKVSVTMSIGHLPDGVKPDFQGSNVVYCRVLFASDYGVPHLQPPRPRIEMRKMIES